MDEEMLKAGRTVVRDCLGLKPGEKFLVITDTEKFEIGEAIFKASLEIEGVEPFLLVMKPRTKHGEEPPEPVAEIWKHVDAFIAPTKYSLSHTQAREKATELGVRGATMPGITKAMFLETLGADYKEIKELCEKMKKALDGHKEVRVVTDLGTDITLGIEGREIIMDTGMLQEKGAFGNLPAGEVFVAPVEGTSNGVIVFDGAIAGVGVLSEPVRVEVKDGFAVKIEGGEEAKRFEELLSSVGKKEAFNVAELGIGTNPKAKIVGNILEDEKVFGTVHIAFGDNSTIGGKTKAGIHLDGIIKEPTVYVDGEKIIEKGKWLI